MGNATSAIEDLADKMEWYEAEIERLKQVCAEQDKRAGTVTTRVEIQCSKDGIPMFIVTCPSGDERRLTRGLFAGLTVIWHGAFASACDGMREPGEEGWLDVANRLFARDP